MTTAPSKADAQALEAFAAGDSLAFTRLYRAHRSVVFRVAYGVLLDEAEARDVVQETFIELHRVRERWRPDASLSTWLYRVALNRALSLRRRIQLAGRALLPRRGPRSPENAVGARQALMVVQRGLERLTPRQRAVVTLSLEAGLSPTDIAATLNLTSNAARVTLHRGLEQLRIELRAAGIDTALEEEPDDELDEEDAS